MYGHLLSAFDKFPRRRNNRGVCGEKSLHGEYRTSMRQYTHILWDWNGTLFNDAWLCVEIINQLLEQHGLARVNAAGYQQEFRFPVRDYYRHIGFDFSRCSYERLADVFVSQYDRRRFECALQPGARQTVSELAARGVRQYILSAYEQRRLEEMVAHSALHDHFTRLVGIEDYYAAGKIAQGLRLLHELGCDATGMVLIGDSLHDYEVAQAMGIDCLLIPSGHSTHARLAECQCPVLGSIHDVLSAVLPPCALCRE